MINAKKGNVEEGYTFAGANAYRIQEIVSVKELFESLEEEYNEAALEFLNQKAVYDKIAI